MLSLLFYQLFVTVTCFNTGFCAFALFFKEDPAKLVAKNSVMVVLTGLVFITLICQILVLFLPINLFASIGCFLIFQLLVFTKPKPYYEHLKKLNGQLKALHPAIKVGFASTWLLLLLLNTGPTLMDDTESYHIQMVKWIQEYGTVPGIANLHERYGFNSSWFSSVALFSLPTQENYYTALNGMVSVWLSLFLWIQADAVFKQQDGDTTKPIAIVSLALLCVLLFLWPLLRGNVSTTNYDFITSAMVLMLFFQTFSNPHAAASGNFQIEYFLWPVYFFTVRIINFPLLLLPLFTLVALFRQGNKKLLKLNLLLAVLLVTPFLARTFLLSGYAFYPSPYFNFVNVDWKVDPKVTDDLLYYIKYYNRVNNMYQPLQQTAALQFPRWILAWYKYLFGYDKLLVILGLSGFLFFSFYRTKLLYRRTISVFVIALVLQLALWFVVAPDPRFVYGPLLCGVILLFYAVIQLAWNKNSVRLLSFGMMSVLILFATTLFVSKLWRDARYRNPVVCRRLPQPSLQKIRLQTVDLYVPGEVLGNWNPRCYAAPLPCLYKVDSRLHLRGKTIKDGFSIQ